MTERVRIKPGGSYFSAPKKDIAFFSTGCKPLDLALGGGWAEGRIANVVGDKSVGKTLIAIEAAANFCIKYPKGVVHYRECEAAFDEQYAAALGMPLDHVDFGTNQLDTVEDLFEDLSKTISKAKHPELYIVDSLDALSDRGELERKMDKGTYGAQKAKNLSQMFRRLVRPLSQSKMTLIIISQVRSKIGISFGRETTRSGGRALDFYASTVLYLARMGSITKTVRGLKRPVGVKVRGKVDKLKVGLPFREADFSIRFGHGIHNVEASLQWLKGIGGLKTLNIKPEDVQRISDAWLKQPDYALEKRIDKVVEQYWYEIETSLMPTRPKYAKT